MNKEDKKKVQWTKEQEEIIQTMIEESESIGYEQGREELLKEIIEDLRKKYIRKW